LSGQRYRQLLPNTGYRADQFGEGDDANRQALRDPCKTGDGERRNYERRHPMRQRFSAYGEDQKRDESLPRKTQDRDNLTMLLKGHR